jgi:hypothetical protein
MRPWEYQRDIAIRAIACGIVVAALSLRCCFACATLAYRDSSVNVGAESAIIVWNSATQTEHFIRSATFNATGPDFGFVVPTPTVPTITTADPSAFDYIREHILPGYWTYAHPPVEKHVGPPLATSSAMPVEVLAEQNVNGTQITTVSASDTDSLKTWMTANGFAWTDDMASWLDPYIKKNWVITLFKYRKNDSGLSTISSSLLDLTFHTAVPFFPYSEPASQRLPGAYAPYRKLTVYLFSDSEVHGTMLPNDEKVEWPGQLLYADRVDSRDLSGLLPLINLHFSDFSSSTWLTVLQDTAVPRAGVADVYFAPTPEQIPTSVAGLQYRI